MTKAYKLADGSLSTDYEVGDEFILTGDIASAWSYSKLGDIVSLKYDDESSCPLFQNHREDWYQGWCCLIPTPEAKRKAQERKRKHGGLVEYFTEKAQEFSNKEKGMSKFTKDDLKDGMKCLMGDGLELYVTGSILQDADESDERRWVELSHYGKDLTCIPRFGLGLWNKLDIMRVIDRDGTVLFERQEPKKMTISEAEKELEEELGYPVEII